MAGTQSEWEKENTPTSMKRAEIKDSQSQTDRFVTSDFLAMTNQGERSLLR